jgi:hypothetical protein
MADVAELIARRDALKAARLNGLREVRDSSGEGVTYKSDAEMASALAAVEREISALQGRSPIKTIIFRTSKGF